MADRRAVLVVGGAGYIGSHAARVLRKHGYEPVIYDNLSTGHEFLAKGFRLITADAGDVAHVRSALRNVAAVMYFAAHAYVGESVENPRKYFQNNVEGALTLLNACIDEGVKAFVFSSGASAKTGAASIAEQRKLRRNLATSRRARMIPAFYISPVRQPVNPRWCCTPRPVTESDIA